MSRRTSAREHVFAASARRRVVTARGVFGLGLGCWSMLVSAVGPWKNHGVDPGVDPGVDR